MGRSAGITLKKTLEIILRDWYKRDTFAANAKVVGTCSRVTNMQTLHTIKVMPFIKVTFKLSKFSKRGRYHFSRENPWKLFEK